MGKFIDLSGQRFNRLTVIEQSGKDKCGKLLWKCRCDCGNEVIVRGHGLKSGDNQSCGCLRKENASIQGSNKAYNLVGKKFNRLKVIDKIGTKNNKIIWKCLCNCGNMIEVNSHHLVSGIVKSCGCLRKEKALKNLQKIDFSNYDFDKRRIGNKYKMEEEHVIIYASNTNNEILVDKDVYELVKKYTWIENKYHYIYAKINKKHVFLARFVMGVEEIHENQITVDHINHNTLDNRRSNLRIASQSQQAMNRGMQGNNTSGTTGVSWKAKIGKWQAQIGYKGENIYLGVYDDYREACEARRKAEVKYFGSYSYKDSMGKT